MVSAVGEKVLEKYVDRDHRISKRKLKRLIDGTRKIQEEQAVGQRKRSVEYDKVMKRQRTMMYDVRNRLLDGGSLELRLVQKLAYERVDLFLNGKRRLTTGDVTRFVLNNISYNLDNRFLNIDYVKKKTLKRALKSYINTVWREKRSSFVSKQEMKEYIRLCALRAIDDAWVEQVDYLQQLQYVVSGRATAQRNPVFEYHGEAYDSFLRMENIIKKEIVRNIF